MIRATAFGLTAVLLVSLTFAQVNSPQDIDTKLSQELKTFQEAINKAVSSPEDPLQKALKNFQGDEKLRAAAMKTLREHAQKDGLNKVVDDIQKESVEEKIRQINQKLRDGATATQLGFPWCLLWGCN